MSRFCSLAGCALLLLASLAACQPPNAKADGALSQPSSALQPVAADAAPTKVAWPMSEDCLGMLSVLKRGLDEGRIIDLDDTPFMMINDTPSSGRWPTFGGRAAPSGESEAFSSEARCVLRAGGASQQQSEHRILGREQVRSRYQSGTRSENNPAYEVAKLRLRQAEKAAKPNKSSIAKVGDPLIDLVGLLVGGALTGIGQWGAGDQLEEALDTLMATPQRIEHPTYRDYHFERARIRASREATLPITLTDRRLQRSWQTSLKRRELRDLFVVSGLDREDEDYARHSQDSLTEDGLRQWLAEAPALPLVDIAAGLLDRPSAAPFDRLALTGQRPAMAKGGSFADDGFMDAAALPQPRHLDGRPGVIDRQPSTGGVSSGHILVFGETGRAEAVFIAPHFILAPSEVVGERGLVDIEDSPGHRALGMVAAVDHGLGLALVQAPVRGRPVAIGDGEPSLISAAPSNAYRGEGRSSTRGKAENAALLADGKLVGFRTARGPDIEGDAIRLFLDQQQHLLPAER